MNRLALFALLALTSSAALAASPSTRPISPTPPGPNAYTLAQSPIAIVSGVRCEIRGGVWATGPQPFVMVSLVDLETGQTYTGETDFHGIYLVSVAFSGTPRSFREWVLDPHLAPAVQPVVVCSDALEESAW